MFSVTLAALVLLAAPSSPEAGRPPLQNFQSRDYRSSPQNWALAQDTRGVLYVGNNSTVMEYDGVSWRLLPTPNDAPVRGLCADARGQVFVGTSGDIGRLEPDARGARVFRSLRDRLPPEHRDFADVWGALCAEHGVYFLTSTRLIRWSGGEMRVWEGALHLAFLVGQTVYVRDTERGLLRLSSTGELLPVEGGERFAKERIYAMLQAPAGHVLVVTRTQGLFHLGEGGVEPFDSDATGFLVKHMPSAGVVLPGGGYAVATLRGGVALLDAQGALRGVLGLDSGLRSTNVKALHVDHDGGLWLALEQGLARVELEATWTVFDERLGLSGATTAFHRSRGVLYAATAVGVFRLRAATGPGHARFERVPGIETQAWDLVEAGDDELAATTNGVYRLDADRARKVVDGTSFAFAATPDGVLYAGTRSGLLRLLPPTSPLETWAAEPVAGLDSPVRFLAVDSAGALWATLLPTGVARLDPDGRLTRFDAEAGLPEGRAIVHRSREGVILATGKGLFVPKGDRFAPFAPGASFARGDASTVAQAPSGALWISGGSPVAPELGVASPEGDGWVWDPSPTRRLPYAYAIHIEAGAVWFGGQAGVRRVALVDRETEPRAPASALIRRVGVPEGEPLYAGVGPLPPLRLPYARDMLRFEFATPAFDAPSHTRYRYQLEGFDDRASSWTAETHRDYTNLPEGRYTFTVVSRDVHDRTSAPAQVAFEVLAPWYRTWWAFAGYAVLGALFVLLAVRAWTWRLRAQNRRLEAIVAARTEEIRHANEENERLLLNVLPAAIAERLKHGEETIVDRFDGVTVLFADVVGFTRLSAQMPADQLVDLLNDLFSMLDALAEEAGVEKIKTIGDAYMAVAGVPEPRDDHALAVMRVALDMLSALEVFNERHDTKLAMRIGAHSGPVVAGVIGKQKFSYDLWGDTVNTASRMESHGAPGRVHISKVTWERVRDTFECEARGEIEVKGKGVMETWFVLGPEGPSKKGPPGRGAS